MRERGKEVRATKFTAPKIFFMTLGNPPATHAYAMQGRQPSPYRDSAMCGYRASHETTTCPIAAGRSDLHKLADTHEPCMACEIEMRQGKA
jgi:hypothetical protein